MDTTVILAQPRVSRLRADAVYVDRSGSVRASAGEPRILDLRMGIFRGDPQKSSLPWRNLEKKDPYLFANETPFTISK